MKKSILKLFSIALMATFPLMFVACGGGGGGGSASTGTVSVGITDANGTFEAVSLTVLEVGIVATDIATTYYNSSDVSILPARIDVLDFANENYLQISDIEVPIPEGAGEVCFNQVRLVLAEEGDPICSDDPFCNYVTTADGTYELKTPSGQQSGVKILSALSASDFCVSEGETTVQVLIDFDPAKAIVDKGNGGYNLKPTGLRIIEGEWSTPPESFMQGLVAIPSYNTPTGCAVLDESDSDLVLVTADQGAGVVVQTGAPIDRDDETGEPIPVYNTALCDTWCSDFTGPEYNSCTLGCGSELTSECYYTGAFKLVLPDLGLYDVTASWEELSALEEDVSYNTSVLMQLK